MRYLFIIVIWIYYSNLDHECCEISERETLIVDNKIRISNYEKMRSEKLPVSLESNNLNRHWQL